MTPQEKQKLEKRIQALESFMRQKQTQQVTLPLDLASQRIIIDLTT